MKTKPTSIAPTVDQFQKYQKAYDYFNRILFGDTLKPCLLNFSRHRGAYGFFSPEKWVSTNGKKSITHEISLNPDLLHRTLAESFGTLVHEMVHQWQQDYGKPPRKCYHNKEWAGKMESVGLIPSHNGEEGGKKTGQKVTHYIDEGGVFSKAMNRMPKEISLPWISAGLSEDKKKKEVKKKIKMICPDCETKVWANEEVAITCVPCGTQYEVM